MKPLSHPQPGPAQQGKEVLEAMVPKGFFFSPGIRNYIYRISFNFCKEEFYLDSLVGIQPFTFDAIANYFE